MKTKRQQLILSRKAGFLGGDVGLAVDKEVRGRYRDFPVLNETFYESGIIKGSNPFYVVAVNEILSKLSRTATPADLEEILARTVVEAYLNKVFVDTALVLRSEDRPNKYLATKLAREIRTKRPVYAKHSLFPSMIPLAGLELEKDQNSRYGLAFRLKEDAKVMTAPELKGKHNGKRFSRTDTEGLPIFDKDGDRFLYTRDSGLSRAYLSNSNLYTDFKYLACSGAYGAGRVVIVSDN